MGNRQIIKRVRQRWVAMACLGSVGWLGLSVPKLSVSAQAPAGQSQICIDETSFYQRDRVTVHAYWSEQAFREGSLQAGANHLVKALELVSTVEQDATKVQILEEFVAENTITGGWLLHGVDRLMAQGDTDAARTVLLSARDAAQELPTGYSRLKIKLLTTMATDYGAIGDLAVAGDLLLQARQLEPNLEGVEFKVNALTSIAQGYNEIRDYSTATELAAQALQLVAVVNYPDSVSRDQAVAAIATIYAQAGDLDQALTLAQSIEQPYERESVIGDVALSAVQAGQRDRTKDLVQQLTLEQPTIRALQEIGLHLASIGDKTEALSYFNQAIVAIETFGYPGPQFTQAMVDGGFAEQVLEALAVAPAGRIQVYGLMDVANHYSTVNNPAAARNVLRQALVATENVEQTYEQQALWEEILRRAMVLEDYELALSTVETLVAKELTYDELSDYTAIGGAAARSGQIDLALQVVERIDPSYRSNRHRVWREIAGAYAVAGDFEAAFAMAEKTQSSAEDYAQALVKIGLSQRQAGLLDESAQTIDRAVQVAEGLPRIGSRLETLNFIALAQTQAGQPVPELFERVLGMVGEVAADPYESFTLQTVGTGWVNAREYGLALRLLDAIAQVTPENPLWRTLLVERLMAEKDYATALDIIESRDVSTIEVDEMLQIADRYIQAGQTDQAVRILTRVSSAPGSGTRQLLRVAELYAHLGQDPVSPVLARAFEMAQTVPGDESKMLYIKEDLIVDDPEDRGSLYEEIAVAYGRAGEFEQGIAIVQALQERDTREQAMNRLNCYRGF
ncbi:tetratricopeptide repeat protein [Leptothoe sp. PORK10 BA2]|uniref:tetratricopeptide repeat protein n=1 Tax=Leptothoe sp. PORK10 BA2 TaxID=3110254 RepID=UPI002B20A6F7|nr:hypothetical protein [Leptothoe sp. PORK10 BA2]MEA5462411.1 hypothetical protein [Leptothoe sp. PORK10 BA2]